MKDKDISYALFTGRGDGSDKIVSDYSAYTNSGMGQFNIFQIYGSLPGKSTYFTGIERNCWGGTFPAVYSIITSTVPGQIISSVIGVGVPEITDVNGIIIARSGLIELQELMIGVESEILEISDSRDIQLSGVRLKGIQKEIFTCGSVIAACVLFSESRGY